MGAEATEAAMVDRSGWSTPPLQLGRSTLIGSLGSDHRAAVTPSGSVFGLGRGWTIEWRVGVESVILDPATTSGVRQRLVESSPVVETRVRVPSGDVVARAYAASAGADAVLVEWENEATVPVALIISLRPYDPTGWQAVGHVEVDGDLLLVDGRPAVRLQREPAAVLAGSASSGDVLLDIDSAMSRALDSSPKVTSARCSEGRAHMTVVLPVPHKTKLRVALSLDGERLDPPDRWPEPAQVVNAWNSHASRGLRVELPEGSLSQAIEANRRYLMLREDEPRGWTWRASVRRQRAELNRALAEWGLLPGRPKASTRSAQPLADLIDHVEQSGPTFAWSEGDGRRSKSEQGAEGVSALLLLARQVLIDDSDSGLVLLPEMPAEWWGQPIEVHDAPTRHGTVSFAVRWHGSRPALLWDRDGRDGIEVVAPVLDPSFRSTAARGEALLRSVDDERDGR